MKGIVHSFPTIYNTLILKKTKVSERGAVISSRWGNHRTI
jgi:hypothetical protein